MTLPTLQRQVGITIQALGIIILGILSIIILTTSPHTPNPPPALSKPKEITTYAYAIWTATTTTSPYGSFLNDTEHPIITYYNDQQAQQALQATTRTGIIVPIRITINQ